MEVIHIPRIGTQTFVNAVNPFDNVIHDNIRYVIYSIRYIDELVANGENVLAELYIANGLDELAYDADMLARVAIVGFKSDLGIVYIPSSMFTITIDRDTVAYVEKLITLPLGALPVDIDLTFLEEELALVIRDSMGLVTTPVTTDVSAVTHFSKAEHDTYQDSLTAIKTNYKTTKLLLQETELKLAQATFLISKLEEKVVL